MYCLCYHVCVYTMYKKNVGDYNHPMDIQMLNTLQKKEHTPQKQIEPQSQRNENYSRLLSHSI